MDKTGAALLPYRWRGFLTVPEPFSLRQAAFRQTPDQGSAEILKERLGVIPGAASGPD